MRAMRIIGPVILAAILIGSWSDAADWKGRAPTTKQTVAPASETKTTTDAKPPLDAVATPQPVEGTSPSVSPTPGDSAAAPVSAEGQVPSETDGVIVGEAVPLVDAQQVPAEITAYEVQWQLISSGGQPATSATYEMNSTVGQAVIGEASSGSYTGQAGYWYGALAVASGCSCPCHADPQCDGVTNVLDVVLAVNVAFRGAAPVTDPDCPRERTDVDCSGFTNVIDVVKFVNVAFRGGEPAVNFCNPCS